MADTTEKQYQEEIQRLRDRVAALEEECAKFRGAVFENRRLQVRLDGLLDMLARMGGS